MKKALLLSVVASTMIMAGGDIAPVEPVVVQEEVSGWDFSGQAVLYYQTRDVWGNGSLFEQGNLADGGNRVGNSIASAGIQLSAVNKDLFYGIGAGAELSGLGALGLDREIVNGVAQSAGDNGLDDAEITQLYLTYGIGNTNLKVGRQQLPKALSPFAFSEGWNVFKNTFEAALLVNTDITDTVLVGAYVYRSNSVFNLGDWSDISAVGGAAEANDGVWMLTAANKSIENLALTGSWYFASDMVVGAADANVLWADAKYNFGETMYGLVLGVQGGAVLTDEPLIGGAGGLQIQDTTAFGAKIGGNFEYFDASIAYSSVDDGTVNIENFGTNVKTPLYTQMVFNQNTIKRDSDTFVARAGIKGLGGKFGIAYNYSDLGATALNSVTGLSRIASNGAIVKGGAGEYSELDLTYKVKVLDGSTTLFAAYVYQNDSRDAFSYTSAAGNLVDVASSDNDQNMLRFWARYNF